MRITNDTREKVLRILNKDSVDVFENVKDENEAAKKVKEEKGYKVIPFNDKGKIRFLSVRGRDPLAYVRYNPQGCTIQYTDNNSKESGKKSESQILKQIMKHYGYPENAWKECFIAKSISNDFGIAAIGVEPLTSTFYDKSKKILYIYN